MSSNSIKDQQTKVGESLFLGKRRLNFWLVGCLLFLTNLNGIQFIGENESVYINNMSVMAWGITSVFAMLIVAEFVIPYYYQKGIITTPDFLEIRFDKSMKLWVSVVYLLAYLLNMMPPILYASATVFQGIFHISELLHLSSFQTITLLSVLIGSLSLVISLWGGIEKIAISDIVVGICLLIVGLSLPYYGFKHIGNGSLTEGFKLVFNAQNTHLNAIGNSQDAIPISTLFTGMMLVNLNYWGVEQFIVQRMISAQNLVESQKGIILTAFGKILSPLMLNVPGLIAVYLYPHLGHSAEVFPRMVADVLPPFLVGITAFVIIGASITSFNAGLSSTSALFFLNIYRPLSEKRGHNLSSKQIQQYSRYFQIGVGSFCMIIAPFIYFAQGGFYLYLQKVGGAFNVPIFTILFMGFVSKKVSTLAAKVGLFFFISTYLITQFVIEIPIHFLHVLAILFVITSGLMLLLSRWYPNTQIIIDTSYVKKSKGWAPRYWFYGILLALSVLLYAFFSPLFF